MSDDHNELPERPTLGAGRRAIIRALASSPVILTVKGALAQTVSDTPSMGNTRKECSNIANTPADKIPPQCKVP